MKHIFYFLIVFLSILIYSCKKETVTVPYNPSEVILIGIDSLGNFEITPNSHADYGITRYQNIYAYATTTNDRTDTNHAFESVYLITNGGDTLIDFYTINCGNIGINNGAVGTCDQQFHLNCFNSIPEYNGNESCSLNSVPLTVNGNIFNLNNQGVDNLNVSFKAICIENNEEYVKVLIGTDTLYFFLADRGMSMDGRFVENHQTESQALLGSSAWCKANHQIYNKCLTTPYFYGESIISVQDL